MLQRSTIEKRVPPVPYLENVGPSGLELHWKALKEAAKRNALMEAAQATGEGTSAQGGVPTPRETPVAANLAIVSKTIQRPSQNQPKGYNEISNEVRRRKEEVVAKAWGEQKRVRGTQPPPKRSTEEGSVGDKPPQGGDDNSWAPKKTKQVQAMLRTPKELPPRLTMPRGATRVTEIFWGLDGFNPYGLNFNLPPLFETNPTDNTSMVVTG